MTTYAISTDTNIDECTSKAGGDTYNISAGATLTIDQDSRYGLNATTSASIAFMTISDTTGGTILIDGRYIRLIPFTDGYGEIALGTTLDCGDASGEVIGIYSDLTSAPSTTVDGYDGYIKIKGWNGEPYPTSGEYTKGGFTFTISGEDCAGWIEILGDEGSQPAITVSYIGTLEMRGEWYELGLTDGYCEQTFQIPSNGNNVYVPGVFVEQTAGEGDFIFRANAGGFTSTDPEDDIRRQICWISTDGVVTLHNASHHGYLPAAGLRVVVPNIITTHCNTSDRTINVIPNPLQSNRFVIGSEYTIKYGTYILDKVNIAWFAIFYGTKLTMSNCGIFDQISIQHCSSNYPCSINTVGVGCSASLTIQPLLINSCCGISIQNFWGWRYSFSSYGNMNIIQHSNNISMSHIWLSCMGVINYSIQGTLSFVNSYNCQADDVTVLGGTGVYVQGSNDIQVSNIHYAYSPTLNHPSLSNYPSYVAYVTASFDITIDGIDFIIDQVAPRTSIIRTTSGSYNVRYYNMGTILAPIYLDLYTGYVFEVEGGATLTGKRVYTTGLRTGFANISDAGQVTPHNCVCDLSPATRPRGINNDWRGIFVTDNVEANPILGIHFWDNFRDPTNGKITLLMSQPSTKTTSYVTLGTGGWWTGANGLHLDSIGQTCTWEMSYFCIGHTGFTGAAAMTGGTASNYLIEFQIDLNDGNGFSTWAEATSDNLTALTVNAVLGFKLKVRITTTTGNTDAISSVYFPTSSTTITQAYQYKLYETPVTIHVMDATTLENVANASVAVTAAAGGEYVAGAAISTGTTDVNGEYTFTLLHDANQPIAGVVCKGSTCRSTFEETVAINTTPTIIAAMCGVYNAAAAGSCF